jgi:hypothetical protein
MVRSPLEKHIIPVSGGGLSLVGGVGVLKKDCFACVNWSFALLK